MSVLDDGARLVTNTASTIDVWNVETRTMEASWPFPSGADRAPELVFLSISASGEAVGGAVQEDAEVLLLIKTTAERLANLSARIEALPDFPTGYWSHLTSPLRWKEIERSATACYGSRDDALRSSHD